MRLPIIPLIVATTILIAAVYIFNFGGPIRFTLDVPRVSRLDSLEGTETEVSISPDGSHYAVIASGDLWLLGSSDSSKRQVTATPEAETFPAWTPDGKAITFTRGRDTFIFRTGAESTSLLKADATSLSWSTSGRTAFVRDRALWLAEPNGQGDRQIVEPDANPDITMHSPRFSPDSVQVGFIKSQLALRAEVWTINVVNGEARPLVADRSAENPLSLEWIMDGKDLVYLTNRAGSYSLWRVDLVESEILPLTQPLFGMPLGRIGIGVWKDRIIVPRHFLDSNLVLSDGTQIIGTENVEFEPAVSPDGKLLAYTIEKDNKFEIWTATISGQDPKFRALGREPRFSPRGFELIYTHTDLAGNNDLWKIDLRNDESDPMTDADEIDITADWAPDGRSAVFSSARGGALSIWTIGSTGGKRLRINDGGYAPRFSGDGRSILFWNAQALWSMNADGSNLRRLRDSTPEPVPALWSNGMPVTYLESPKQPIWPRFDVLPDGRWIVAPIEIRETSLWAVDLLYKKN